MVARFTGPYQLPKQAGGRVPPVRGGSATSAGSPIPKRDYKFSRGSVLNKMMFRAMRQLVNKAAGPYIALAQIDPNVSRARAQAINNLLSAYMPAWYYRPAWYNLDGWKTGWAKVTRRDPNNNSPVWNVPGNPQGISYCNWPGGGARAIDKCTPDLVSAFGNCLVGTPPPPVFGDGSTVVLWHIITAQDGIGLVGQYCGVIRVGYASPANPYAPYLSPGYTGPFPQALLPFKVTRTMPVPLADPWDDPWVASPGEMSYGDPMPFRGPQRLKPYQVPATTYTFGPKGPSKPPSQPPHNRLPPGPRVKEKKFRLGNKLSDAVGDLAGALSEQKDFTKALADAIPHHPCRGMSLPDMTACVYKNMGKIQWSQALLNLIMNEIQDQAIGRMAGATTRNFGQKGLLIGGRGYNISRLTQNHWR